MQKVEDEIMKLYGSVNNRFDEGKQYCEKLEVGTGMTEYMWSDRHAYEVSRVIDQEHIFVRRMKAERIDNNGMSDAQDYKYISTNEKEIELVKRRGVWCKVFTYSKEMWMQKAEKNTSFKTKEVAYNYYKAMSGLTDCQKQKIEQGKEVKKYVKWENISFGVMEEYFDYSF